MSTNNCTEHNQKNDHAICLDDGCNYIWICKQCPTLHEDHKLFYLQKAFNEEEDELSKVFDRDLISEMGKNSDELLSSLESTLKQDLNRRESKMKEGCQQVLDQ